MEKNKKKHIHFVDDNDDHQQNNKNTKNKWSKFFSKKTNNNNNNNNKNKNSITKKQKQILIRYLSVEEPITKHSLKIDDYERQLIENKDYNDDISNIDLNKYFQIPKTKINKKLWRIPYQFSNNNDDDDENIIHPPCINRFGEGIDDGCIIGLNLPKIKQSNDKKQKTWEEIIDDSDEILNHWLSSQIIITGSGRKINKKTQKRRGSILQPGHLYLMPNPESNDLLINLNNKKNNILREWSSEPTIDIRQNDDQLLDSDYRQNLLINVSIDDLSNAIYPEFKFNNFNDDMTDSEILFIQKIINNRRQSLVFSINNNNGDDSIKFRRKSFIGGELWSTDIQQQQQRNYYYQKLSIINPQHNNKLNTIIINNNDNVDHDDQITTNHFNFDDDDELFDPNSNEQIMLFSNELTIIVRKYLNSIKSSEIINYLLNNYNLIKNNCPNIMGLFYFQNRIIRLIATYILNIQFTLNQRIQSILFFIRVIQYLKNRLNNWHSINLIIKSLQSPSIVRLKQTWRKITFNYPDDYLDFIKTSEDLNLENQWSTTYDNDNIKHFLPIFDDIIDMIKEQCGIMIVQIKQHRFHQTWQNYHHHDIIDWVTMQINKLYSECNVNLDNDNDNDQLKKEKKSILKKLFHRKANDPTVDDGQNIQNNHNDNNIDIDDDDDDDDTHQKRLLKGSKNELTNIVSRRRKSSINSSKNSTKSKYTTTIKQKLPSGKQFWSIAEFYKLRQSERELIKQQIVRTMVTIQKKAFYVFQERDNKIKDFLLNANCDSLDQCMKKSQMIENQQELQQQRLLQKHNDDDDRSNQQGNGNELNQSNDELLSRKNSKPKRKVMFS